MTVANTVNHLKHVAEKEGIQYEEEALAVIAEKADGGMRDALSIFDQAASFCQGNITYKKVIEDLNVLDSGIYKKLSDVSVWQLMDLHDRLLTKHHETFWIDVDSRIIRDKEYFRVTTIDHTKNPIPSQFDILLEQGKITVDFLLCRDSGGDTYSFKVGKKDRALLFPESETYIINSI